MPGENTASAHAYSGFGELEHVWIIDIPDKQGLNNQGCTAPNLSDNSILYLSWKT